MCGIVGFTTPGQDPAAAKQIVQGMADLIRHRGPDGEGCYADGTAALGHRRLSVIDLAGGGQPMLNEDDAWCVVFNGEIYNYKTLRARLQQRGHTFATDSDTEVLVHGYEEWGRDLPCRLRGMFAFWRCWDRTPASTLLSRGTCSASSRSATSTTGETACSSAARSRRFWRTRPLKSA